MLEAVELPTSIANLATGLANVDADALFLAKDYLLKMLNGDMIIYEKLTKDTACDRDNLQRFFWQKCKS